MKMLELKDIHAGYGPAKILHGLSISVSKSEIGTIIGPNGCGKSTLIKSVMGLVTWRKGTILFSGDDIVDLPTAEIVRRGISYVPQLANVFKNMTVLENLEMGAYLLNKTQRDARVEEILAAFPKLRERLRQKAGSMSGGERQLVALGSALMTSPSLMLLDEPSAGLSPSATDDMFERIHALTRSLDLTILLVEQNVHDALKISDRVYVLAMGQNEFEGTAEEVLSDPRIQTAYLGGTGEDDDA